MIHENVKEIRRNSSDLGLGVRFKSCVTVQAPAQFGTHKNDSFQVFRIRNCVIISNPCSHGHISPNFAFDGAKDIMNPYTYL